MNAQPKLVLDTETGLYDIILDGCIVEEKFDLVGVREQIRNSAINDTIESMRTLLVTIRDHGLSDGLRAEIHALCPPEPSPSGSEGAP